MVDLAKYINPGIYINDHGFLMLNGHFKYEDGTSQGLGFLIDKEFIKRFIRAFGVRSLDDVRNNVVRVYHTRKGIKKIEALDNISNGKTFDIEDWKKELEEEKGRLK